MTKDFKHIVITGASSGIGEALAYAYAEQGVRLGLVARRNDLLEAVAQKCRDKGADVSTSCIDVTDSDALSTWLIEVDQEQPVDLVIANAGISGGTGGDGCEGPEQVRKLFEVNVTGVLNTIDPLLPQMIERRSGHVAIMSSLAAFRGWPGAPAYCASKAAVKTYGEGLHGMLANTNVCVSVICPGFVKSPMTDKNDYAMPFLVPTERAAQIIMSGLKSSKSRISFPFPVNFFAWLFGAMPDRWAHYFLKGAPSKKSLD